MTVRSAPDPLLRSFPVPDERDDAELVRLVAADDMDALRVLYERYGSIVFGMARRVLGDRQLAEECTQDVFVALWRGAAKYEPGARPGEYLADRDHEVSGDRPRTPSRGAARRPLRARSGSGDESPDSADLAATADQAQRVAAAVAELPLPQREALMLAYFEGLSHSEIADRLEVPLGTVKGRIRLALDRLRELAPEFALNAERSNERGDRDLAATHALGALPPVEAARSRRSWPKNARLATEVEEYRTVVETLESGHRPRGPAGRPLRRGPQPDRGEERRRCRPRRCRVGAGVRADRGTRRRSRFAPVEEARCPLSRRVRRGGHDRRRRGCAVVGQ